MTSASVGRFMRRLLRQLARPARRDEGAEGLVAEPYRGYSNRRELYFMGRVYRQPGGPAPPRLGDLRASLRRLFRRGAAAQALCARFAGAEQRVVTDDAGYFRVHLEVPGDVPIGAGWQSVALELDLPSGGVATATAEVFAPPPSARFVVISDIDDTVMFTGVARKLGMLWRLFAQGPESRVAFPGVAALYRALHGADGNPMLYLSRAPWSIYEMLEAFFRHHDIPVGPVLFLRDWGLSRTRPLPRRGRGHKLALIRDMLSVYRDLPFVLIGDSGQHDPETYAQVVREHPGRVAAILIRNVSRDPRRIAVIENLAREVLEAGSSLLLAADSVAMAEHAVRCGLVPPSTIDDVVREHQEGRRPRRRSRLIALRRPGRRATERAVAEGALEKVLKTGEGEPPSTLVESAPERRE